MPCCVLAVLVPPLAAAGDWLEALLPILFVIFWIVSQVMNVVKSMRGEKGGAPVPPARPAPARPAPGPPAAAGRPLPDASRAELDRQIEAFRRAQAEAAGQRDRAANRPAAPPRRDEPRPQPAPRPRSGASGTPPARPATPARPRPQAAERAAPPAAPPPLAGHGGEIARHVEGAFAHDLAHSAPNVHPDLDAGRPRLPATASQGPRSTAEALIAMMRDPDTVRQAILLREILDRPVERW